MSHYNTISNELITDEIRQMIPESINLAEIYKYRIYEQGDIPMCSACSATSLLEYLRQKEGLEFVSLSHTFVYFQARLYERKANKIAPVTANSVINAILNEGVCKKECWKDCRSVFERPTNKAVRDALTHLKCSRVNLISVDVNTIKYVLGVLKLPIVASLCINKEYFNRHAKDIISNHTMFNLRTTTHHSVLFVGYDSTGIIFQNSWSDKWGNKGFGKLAYNYIPLINHMWSLSESCVKSINEQEEYELIEQEIMEMIEQDYVLLTQIIDAVPESQTGTSSSESEQGYCKLTDELLSSTKGTQDTGIV